MYTKYEPFASVELYQTNSKNGTKQRYWCKILYYKWYTCNNNDKIL